MNYTNKTQFLFRIEKGVLDVNDQGINDYFSPEDIRVPFRNIVYIGDSDTDIPCMKLVNTYGGHSIGVYNADTQDKTKVYKMMRDNRVKYYVAANYSEGEELDLLVKSIIDRTVTNEVLETIHYKNKKECMQVDKQNNEEEKRKTDLIISIENSKSFANTHAVVHELSQIAKWTPDEIGVLMDIAVNNRQVWSILNDTDVKMFYQKLLSKMYKIEGSAKKVGDELEKHSNE